MKKYEVCLWTADWCGPCQILKGWMEESHPHIPIKDIDRNKKDLPAEPQILTVPALQVTKGDKTEVFAGIMPIRKHLDEKGGNYE